MIAAPMCCRFRGQVACTALPGTWATSWFARQWRGAKRAGRARQCTTTGRTLWCMVSCICRAMTILKMRKRRSWNRASAGFWPGWISAIPMRLPQGLIMARPGLRQGSRNNGNRRLRRLTPIMPPPGKARTGAPRRPCQSLPCKRGRAGLGRDFGLGIEVWKLCCACGNVLGLGSPWVTTRSRSLPAGLGNTIISDLRHPVKSAVTSTAMRNRPILRPARLCGHGSAPRRRTAWQGAVISQ